MSTSAESRAFFPKDNIDAELAEMCANLADHQLHSGDSRPRIVFGNGEEVELPSDLSKSWARCSRDARWPRHYCRANKYGPFNPRGRRPTRHLPPHTGTSPRRRRHSFHETTAPSAHSASQSLDYQERQRRNSDDALSSIVTDTQAFDDYDLNPQAIKSALQSASWRLGYGLYRISRYLRSSA